MPIVAVREIHSVNRWEVTIPGIDSIGLFRDCTGLSIEYDVLEYAEGGNYDYVHKLPGVVRYENIKLSRGLTNEKAFMDWLVATRTQAQRKEVTVKLLSGPGAPVRTWTFADAFPVKWTGPVLDADGSVTATEMLEIAHSGLKGV